MAQNSPIQQQRNKAGGGGSGGGGWLAVGEIGGGGAHGGEVEAFAGAGMEVDIE